MEELERRLRQHQVETKFKFKGGTTEVQGISFKLGNDIFKGSSIDRDFSYNNLKRQLVVAEKEIQQIDKSKKLLYVSAGEKKNINTDLSTKNNKGLTNKVLSREASNTLEILLRPEQNNEQIPFELMKKQHRKKKKGQRPQALH